MIDIVQNAEEAPEPKVVPGRFRLHRVTNLVDFGCAMIGASGAVIHSQAVIVQPMEWPWFRRIMSFTRKAFIGKDSPYSIVAFNEATIRLIEQAPEIAPLNRRLFRERAFIDFDVDAHGG